MAGRITNIKRSNRYVDGVVTNDLYSRYQREKFGRHYYDLLMTAVQKSFPVAVVLCFQILPRLDSSLISFRSFLASYKVAIGDVAIDRGLNITPVPVTFNPYKHNSRADRLHLNFIGIQVMFVVSVPLVSTEFETLFRQFSDFYT